jgi:hypothetical protein
MKKLIYLLPFAALAMVSCSNSEEVMQTAPQAKNAELRIFPQVGGTTRGTLETSASLTEFKLIPNGSFATAANGAAAAYSTAMDVTKEGGIWTLGTPLFWGDGTTSASFTAFAPKDADYTTAAGKLTDFTIAEADPSGHKDLIVAYNSGVKGDFASGVPLHFQHALAQVLVNANYTYDNTLDADQYPNVIVKVKGVKFANLYKTGTLTLPTASTVSSYNADWAYSGTSTAKFLSERTDMVTLGSTNASVDNSAAVGPMLLLPQTQSATTDLAATTVTGSYLLVEVDIDYATGKTVNVSGTDYTHYDFYPEPTTPAANQTAGEGNTAWVAVPVSIDWKSGYKYTYTLNFTNAAFGKVAPTVDGGEGTPGEPLVVELLTPVSFLVTVESEWTEQSVTPAM